MGDREREHRAEGVDHPEEVGLAGDDRDARDHAEHQDGHVGRTEARVEEALAVFLEAVKLDPYSVEANNNVGNVLGDLGRYDEAVPYLQHAIAKQPGLADAHHGHATGDHLKALADEIYATVPDEWWAAQPAPLDNRVRS